MDLNSYIEVMVNNYYIKSLNTANYIFSTCKLPNIVLFERYYFNSNSLS